MSSLRARILRNRSSRFVLEYIVLPTSTFFLCRVRRLERVNVAEIIAASPVPLTVTAVSRTESLPSLAAGVAVEPSGIGGRMNSDDRSIVGAAAAAAKTRTTGAEGVLVLSLRGVRRDGVQGAAAAVPAAAVLAKAAESAVPTLGMSVTAAFPAEREGFLLFFFSGDDGQNPAFRCDWEIPAPAQEALTTRYFDGSICKRFRVDFRISSVMADDEAVGGVVAVPLTADRTAGAVEIAETASLLLCLLLMAAGSGAGKEISGSPWGVDFWQFIVSVPIL